MRAVCEEQVTVCLQEKKNSSGIREDLVNMNTFPSVVICDLPMQRKTTVRNLKGGWGGCSTVVELLNFVETEKNKLRLC